MKPQILDIFLNPGSGYIFPFLFLDVVAVIFGILLTKNIILPAWKSYSLAKRLDRVCGTDSKHWFYGHIKKYGFSASGVKNQCKRTKTFPYIFNGWVGPVLPEVICHHSDSSKALIASGAPKNEIGYKFIRPWVGDGLLTSSGKKWKRNRRLLTPAFHYSILKSYLEIFNKSAKLMLKNWEPEIDCAVDVTEAASLMTLDTMLQCVMSYKTDCQNLKGDHSYVKAVKDLTEAIMERLENPPLLIDWIFNFTSHGRKFKRAADVVHGLSEKIIKSRRKELNEKHSYLDERKSKKFLDFVDILIETKDEDGKGLTDAEIRDEVDTFLFEGHDTTASAIAWCIYNLAKYPNFQEKCRDEITDLLKDKADVEWDDLAKLEYLTMFIKESMRVAPPVTVVGRYLKEPLTLPISDSGQQVTIPSEVSVSIQIIAQHHNPHIWDDPEKFDPERFTWENISKRSPHAYIPFSAGPRNCIGQNFAMNEIKVVVAQCLRKYRFYLDHETPPPRMKPLLILWSENGIFVKFESM